MPSSSPRRRLAACATGSVLVAAVLAGCSSGGTTDTAAAPAAGALSGVCPSTVKIQTGWYPQPEKGALYQLVGANGTVDKDNGSYSGAVEGVTVSVLAGGPYLGNQSTVAKMYQDPSILLGEVSTDDAIEVSAKQPVIGVVAPLQKSPKAVIYDPSVYQFTSIADVGSSGATILKAGEDASTDLLIAQGDVQASQFDYSYDGSPARFITSKGKAVFVEYATQIPYKYENLPAWGKPLSSILLADGGYTTYENSLSVTPENETKYDACLTKLVPLVQKAMVAYAADPTPVDDAMKKYADEVKSPTELSDGGNAFAHQVMKDKGIVANGADGTAGSFDTTRVAALVTSMGAVADKSKITLKSGLTADDVVTDKYLDTTIAIGS